MSENISYNPELVEEMTLAANQDEGLQTIQDFLRWTYSCFNASDIFYGHGQDKAVRILRDRRAPQGRLSAAACEGVPAGARRNALLSEG